MARTRHHLPLHLLEEKQPDLDWFRIVNTSTRLRRGRNGKQTLRRAYWGGERQRVRRALQDGDPAPGRISPHRVRADLW